MKELCVVHLVRAANGIEPFRRFLESYQKNPGGIEHDLLIIFKGFSASYDAAEYRKLLTPFRYSTLEIVDEGYDITAYFAATRQFAQQYRTFCFLNSYSIILDPEWLKKLYENMSKPGVGLVGATGSWVSHRTNAIEHIRNPCAYFRSLRREGSGENRIYTSKIKCLINLIASVFEWVWCLPPYLFYFDPFPNPFIRTNGFMISGEVMNGLNCPPIKTKMDAYRFESGKHGLTRKILALGKKVLVVGKDGSGYTETAWNESKTLFQSNQENLLIADNRTCDYQYGSPERRRYLSYKAWR